MKKEKIIKAISEETKIKKKKCEEVFEYIFELISSELKNKNEVTIENLGSFSVRREEMKIEVKLNRKTVVPPGDVIQFKSFLKAT